MFVVGLTVPEAVALIDEIVLGVPCSHPTPVAPKPLRRRAPRIPRPATATATLTPCPLDSVILTPPSPPSSVTPTVPGIVLPRLRVSPHVSGLVPGYCWLAAVPDHCWHYVAPAVGPYPTVRALRKVPEFFPFQAWLEPVRAGLYHLVTSSPSRRAIPYAFGVLDWVVGASHRLPFRPNLDQSIPLSSANSYGMAQAPRIPAHVYQDRAPPFPPPPPSYPVRILTPPRAIPTPSTAQPLASRPSLSLLSRLLSLPRPTPKICRTLDPCPVLTMPPAPRPALPPPRADMPPKASPTLVLASDRAQAPVPSSPGPHIVRTRPIAVGPLPEMSSGRKPPATPWMTPSMSSKLPWLTCHLFPLTPCGRISSPGSLAFPPHWIGLLPSLPPENGFPLNCLPSAMLMPLQLPLNRL